MANVKHMGLAMKDRVIDDRLSLVAAGVAFYTFLSIFPALATIVSTYGLISDPQTVQEHISHLSKVVPDDVMGILSRRMRDLAQSADSSLSLGFVIGIIVSLWSANRAMKAVSQALNVAYDQAEDRGFIKVNLITLLLTLLSSVVFIVALSVIVALPVIVTTILSQQSAKVITTGASWTVFIGLLVGVFLVLYRFAPARYRHQSWRALLPGALLASLLFLLSSVAFSFYVSNFAKYDEQYGALGAVVVAMLWLFIGSFIFLLGAELNAEREYPISQRHTGTDERPDRQPTAGIPPGQ